LNRDRFGLLPAIQRNQRKRRREFCLHGPFNCRFRERHIRTVVACESYDALRPTREDWSLVGPVCAEILSEIIRVIRARLGLISSAENSTPPRQAPPMQLIASSEELASWQRRVTDETEAGFFRRRRLKNLISACTDTSFSTGLVPLAHLKYRPVNASNENQYMFSTEQAAACPRTQHFTLPKSRIRPSLLTTAHRRLGLSSDLSDDRSGTPR